MRNKSNNSSDEFGFGSKHIGQNQKLINEDGTFNIVRLGTSSKEMYEHLILTSWKRFFTIIFVVYILANVLFGFIFQLAGVEHIQGLKQGNFVEDFMQCFFLSVQTFTSVGYGGLLPNNTITNLISTVDALVGLLTFTLLAGLFYARFAKAKAGINFSKNAVITKLNGQDTFQFRIVNTSEAILINVEASVTMTWIETLEQTTRRRFQRLALQMDSIYLFPLNWTIVHPIDETSPLHGCNKDFLDKSHVEFLVMIRAYNDTYGQNVFKNHSYHYYDIIQNAKFLSMYDASKDGTTLYINKLDDIEKIDF